MEENATAEKIISQAAQWSFEGDCSLLAWMQKLSQNLEQRATLTSDALQQLSVDVNRTAIALDNAANSLTALQYTQFVESRCHDDDETLANTVNLPVEVVTASTGKLNTPNEVLETFLRKNLQMLHNSHEKYVLDFEDSDEDEANAMNNCIYQPKNPYNDELLPHIYGSKLWKEHWHVGLCDGPNEYSGDEASDAFSTSSRSSTGDNESYESNTANLSGWTSNTSIPIEHKHPALVATENEPAMPSLASATTHNRRVPITPLFPRNDDSDSCSTTSRSTTTNPPTRLTGEHDLFAVSQNDTPTTSTSAATSSPQHRQSQTAHLVQGQRKAAQGPLMLPPFFDATPPTDIFTDAASTRQSMNSRETDSVRQRATISQSRRNPVNLFDDDDFNSLMAEVEETSQTKVDQQAQLPIPTTKSLPTKNEADFIATAVTKPKTVDLFAELSNIETPVQSQFVPVGMESPKEIKRRKPLNLFDSPEGSPPNDSLFSSAIASEKKDTGVVKPALKQSITAKSLFDDDEDDDDFLNVFGAEKSSLLQRSSDKTLLFDDDKEEKSQPTKQPTRLTSNLFNGMPNAEDTVQSTVTFEKSESTKLTDSGTIKESANGSSIKRDSPTSSQADFINDFENNISPKTTLTPAGTGAKPQTLDSSTIKQKNKLFGGGLFGDEGNDDLEDLFKKQSTTQQSTKSTVNQPIEKVSNNAEPAKSFTKEIMQQSRSLFGKEYEDDDDLFSDEDDLFSDRLAKRDTKYANYVEKSKKAKIAESPKIDVSNEDSDKIDTPKKISHGIAGASKKVAQSTSLFADDFDDEADDLFSVKPTAKQILNQKTNTGNLEIKDNAHSLLEHKTDNKTQVNQTTVKDILKANQAPQKAVQKPAADVIQQRPLFENDFESEEKDLLSKTNQEIFPDVTKDKNASNSETNKYDLSNADEPTKNALFKKSGAAIPINGPQKNTAVGESVSNSTVTGEKASNNEILTTRLLQKSDDSLAIAQHSKLGKTASVTESTEHEEKSAAIGTPRKGSEIESDSEQQENITSNAEPSLKTSINSATDKDTRPSLFIGSDARNNEYPSIFLDEPPDDDDFFTTLSSNKQPLSVSKLTLDLESDFYEPGLPPTPSAAKTAASLAATNNQLDGNSKQQLSSSDYGGLRLFSEIPPDDDGDDFSFAASTKYAVEKTVTNQRLHSVFYDDFSETLEAVQQIKEKQTAAHALFNDEPPPPDEDNFDIIEKVVQKRQQANREEDVENVLAPVDQTACVNNYDTKGDGESHNNTSVTAPSKDVTDRTAAKVISISRSPAGKLQMPNIKINVQALLPGGGGKPSFKKSSTTPESTEPADTQMKIPKLSTEISKAPTRAALILTAPAEPANENILPSVCKTRVRAPAGRRPSTRRARQETYRQSLIAEQADFDEEDDAFENLRQANAPSISSLKQQPKKDKVNISTTQTLPNKDITEKLAKQASSSNGKPTSSRLNANLFEDDDDDDDANDSLFSATFIRNASRNIPSPITDLNTSNSKADHAVAEKPLTRPVQAAVKGRPAVTKDFAENNDDEVDELFKGVHAAPMDTTTHLNQAGIGGKTTTKSVNITATANASKSLFGTPPSEDSDDDIFKSSKSALTAKSAVTTQATKPLAVRATTATNVNAQPKTATATTADAVGGGLDSIFGSDAEGDDFLSNLKPKKKTTTTSLKVASAGSTAKRPTQSSGGLFGDIESDEDDLFGGKSKVKQDSLKAKLNTAKKTKFPPASSSQKPTTTTATPNMPATLADNPLADLLNP